MLKSKHVIPAIELLGIGSLTAVGLAVGGPIGAGVMGAIGLNLSSNLLEGAKAQLKEKWLNGDYGVLNHDIQQALVRAFVKALNYLESEYFKTEDAKLFPRDQKRAVRRLCKMLRDDAPKMFAEAGDHANSCGDLHSFLAQEPRSAHDQLWDQIGQSELFQDSPDDFKACLRDWLFDQVVAQFGEELKLDNKESSRAWRAFERLLLEDIHVGVEKVKASQTAFANAIDAGFAEFRKLKGVAVVVGRIERKVDAVANAVDGVAENVTESVSARLATSSAGDAQYLLEHSCELSNRGEDDRALEVVEEATRLARLLKNEKLERACLLHEANVLFWHKTDEQHIPQSAISRLDSILRRFEHLGQETSHAFQVKLHLSRLRGNHDETIANCRSILQCNDDFVDAKVEAITALLVALAQLDRVDEMDDLVGDVEALAAQCESDQEITLQMNWLLANADIGQFQQGLVQRVIRLMATAMAAGEFEIPHAIDAVHTVGPRLQRAADRMDQRDWHVAAYKLFEWGYKLAEQIRDAKRAIEFCEQLASLSVRVSKERSEAMQWIKQGELTFSWPTQFESSDARLASQCFFTYAKARVLWRLTKRYDGPKDQLMHDGLLRGALKAFQEAADLFERCHGAIDGDADLLAGDGVFAQGKIYADLGDYAQSLNVLQKLWDYPSFQNDAQRAFDAGTHLGALYAIAGAFERAWLIHNMLDKHPKLTPELRNRLAEFNSYLKDMETKHGKGSRDVVPGTKPKDENT